MTKPSNIRNYKKTIEIILSTVAGVTIQTLTGENGLLTKAGEAKKLNEMAIAKEKLQVEVSGSYGLDGKIDLDELNKNLKQIEGLTYNDEIIDINNDSKKINELPSLVNISEYCFQININGDVSIPTIGVIKSNNYGDYIDLGQNVVKTSATTDDWRILYNDKNGYVYAILADYLPNTDAAVASAGFKTDTVNDISGTYIVYSSTSRQNLLDRLNNIIAWQSLIPERLRSICQVKGATTVEIIMASYNEKYATDLAYTSYPYLRIDPNDSTSSIDTLYMPHPGSSHYNGCYGYWLASPNESRSKDLRFVRYDSCVSTWDYSKERYGVCPVVSLPADVQVTKNGTVWTVIQ